MVNIKENWDKIVLELTSVKRDGMTKLIDYLVKQTDFRTAPASTKYHLNTMGGLTQHSLNVLRFGRLVNKELALDIQDESLIITGLLHDLCKTNYYVEGEEWDKEWKDKTNQWRKKKVWKVEDTLPLGHGEKSVILIVQFIPLLADEMTAIRYHMGFADAGMHFNYPSGFSYREAMDKYSLVKLLMVADQLAELAESYADLKKTV